jgi:type IV pilus assembly protein PilP
MRRPTQAVVGVVLAAVLAGPSAAEDGALPGPGRAASPETDAPYVPTGRRDPFRPPRAAASVRGETITPLQRYDIGQLRLVAIIYDTSQPRAVVEDDQGIGYIVRVGTQIGPNGGQVEGIERGRVLIKEESLDFYGEARPASVVMELRTSDGGKR